MHLRLAATIAFVALLSCNGDKDEALPPPSPERTCNVMLEVDKPPLVRVVQVAGSFNDWLPATLVLDDDGSTFVRDLGPLRPGTHAYKLIYDGVWQDPAPDQYTVWAGGFENLALRVGNCRVPKLTTVSGQATADGTLDASFQFERAFGGSDIDPESVAATVGDEAVDATVDPDRGSIDIAVTGLKAGKHSVRLTAADLDGKPVEADAFLPLWVEDEAFDWADGSVYFVFTDRFRDGGDDGSGPVSGTTVGTDWLGGDLVGAREALEEGWFEDLGVRTLWLSPVYDNPDGAYGGSFNYQYTGYHGYWPIHPTDVEERWGAGNITGEEALQDLIDAAHARGIRVVLDTVLNHVHEDHVYIDEHPEWFGAAPCPCTTNPGACNWDTNPLGCWFTDYLPDLDYRNAKLTDQVLDDLIWWVETYDVDGFRVDAAKHMDHVVMRSMSLALRDRYEVPGGAEFYLVGETFTGQGGQGLIMDYVSDHELDGQFDFPLLYPIRGAIGGQAGFRGLSSEVAASDAAYGEHVHRMSVFMGNHDVARYVNDIVGCPGYDPYNTLFGWCPDPMSNGSGTIDGTQWDLINKLSMSWLFVATQPGVPLLYYGDEIGLGGAGDPDNRRMMLWGNDLSAAQEELLSRAQEIGQARTRSKALRRGERKELWVDDTLYVYARYTDNDVAIVAMHIGGSPRTESIPIPASIGLKDGTQLSNMLNNPTSWSVSGGNMNLQLDPWEYVIVTPK